MRRPRRVGIRTSNTCPHGNDRRECNWCKTAMPDEFKASNVVRLNPGRNFDYPMPLEGRMAKSYLWSIEKDARELRQQLLDDDDLPGWVNAKIVTAADRISTVNRYMGHKIARARKARKNTGSSGLVAPALTIAGFLFVAGLISDKMAERSRRRR